MLRASGEPKIQEAAAHPVVSSFGTPVVQVSMALLLTDFGPRRGIHLEMRIKRLNLARSGRGVFENEISKSKADTIALREA
jgi:hypothetical protein